MMYFVLTLIMGVAFTAFGYLLGALAVLRIIQRDIESGRLVRTEVPRYSQNDYRGKNDRTG